MFMIKRRNYTFSITHTKANYGKSFSTIFYEVTKVLRDNSLYWAYVVHDHDVNDDGSVKPKHLHCYIEFPNPRSLHSVAQMFQLDDNFIEVVKSKKGILRYLQHLDDPEKYQYPDDAVKSNFPDWNAEVNPLRYEEDEEQLKVEWNDYCKLREGLISPQDFFQSRTRYIVRHSFSTRLMVFERIYNASLSKPSPLGTAGLSKRFRVSGSSREPPQ